jgi:hypothetical protein
MGKPIDRNPTDVLKLVRATVSNPRRTVSSFGCDRQTSIRFPASLGMTEVMLEITEAGNIRPCKR